MRHVRHVSSGKHKRRRRGDMHSRRLPTQQRSLVLLTARLQHPNRDQDRSASQSRDHRQPGQHQERARHSQRHRRAFRRLLDQGRRRHAADRREDHYS